jgi:dolichol-phosphate mannosyltransferase
MTKNNNSLPEISVIIPVYNEEDNIQLLYKELCKILENAEVSFELIFVDDGSEDHSLEIIKQLSRDDFRVRYASFSRNFGHEAASSCGLQMAKGKAALLVDADFQDPPELILEMYDKWKQGYEVVCA